MKKSLFIAIVAVWMGFLIVSPAVSAASPSYRWHTFYGSSEPDRAYGIVVDASDCSIIVGRSKATWNGPLGQAPKHDHSPGDNADLFVLKLGSDGVYQWHTFFGEDNSTDYAMAAAVDGDGNILVAGFSWGDYPPVGEHSEALVLKLSASGDYQWHTFYGAGYRGTYDEGHGIAVDGNGDVFVAMKSDDTWTGPSGELPKNDYVGGPDIAVLKLDRDGAYQWHTFYGSDEGAVVPASIAVDGNAVYVTGNSGSGWKVGTTSPLNGYSGGDDIVVIKLNTGDGAYQWHTFYGSLSNDGGNGIAARGGSVYVAGYSFTAWDGPAARPPRHSYSGQADITVLKLDSAGTYQWHTFYGSAAADDFGLDLALNSGAGVFVVGRSLASWLYGSTGPAHPYTGGADLVIVKIDSAGAYGWHTFYGSSDEDLGQDIAVDSRGDIHAAGTSRATWAGDGEASPLHAYTGDQDLFELVLADGAPAPVPSVHGWGLIAFAAGLWAFGIRLIRRRTSSA
jgi:hypothetical protein